MKTSINNRQNNVVIINKKTGEQFFGDNPYELMENLGKRYKGESFHVKVLNPKYNFYMK